MLDVFVVCHKDTRDCHVTPFLVSSYTSFTTSKHLLVQKLEKCVKYVQRTPERRHCHRYGVFTVNSKHISHFFLVYSAQHSAH